MVSKVLRVRYEGGVLKPLERVDFHEGEELVVFVRKRRVQKVLDKYVGIFGEADAEELRLLEEEAHARYFLSKLLDSSVASSSTA